MSKVSEQYIKLDNTLSNDPELLNQVVTELGRIVTTAYRNSLDSDEGYCFKFMLPMTAVDRLFSLMKVNKVDLGNAFQSDWKFPSNANMYNDSYYQILILLFYYGLRKNIRLLPEYSLFTLLMKIWNGRKSKFLKYCDKRVMNYVTMHMVNNKHLVTKYDSPVSLLRDYFVPTLMKKYGPEILKDVFKLRQLFMQTWVRVNQLFASNMRTNAETQQREAQGGLLYLYMKAKSEGKYMATPTIISNDDEESEESIDQYSTIHNRDDITSNTTDQITMNVKPQYPESFIANVNSYTRVSSKVIDVMMKSLHSHQNYDIIHNIISILLSRANIVDKNDICKPIFIQNIKKNVISSKNTEDIKNLQKLLDDLLIEIFKNSLNLDFKKYSNVQQIQIRNVIIYGLIYNLRKYNCQGQVGNI